MSSLPNPQSLIPNLQSLIPSPQSLTPNFAKISSLTYNSFYDQYANESISI